MNNFLDDFRRLKLCGMTLVEARDELLDEAVTDDNVYDINNAYEELYSA